MNPFSYYQELIEGLLEIPQTNLLPLCELQTTNPTGKRLIGLRHDIDSNPETALKFARFLAWKGVCGSFYLQPTAPYYGKIREGQFTRTPQLDTLVTSLIIAGCELGIHNDVYGAYEKGIDGLKQLKQEIQYLRGLGAKIHGTVAHATAAAYGAENFEIFREYRLFHLPIKYPIHKISQRSLDLSYEGNFPIPIKNPSIDEAERHLRDIGDIRNEKWMRKYLIENPTYRRNVDFQIWLIDKDKWVLAGENLFKWNLTLPQLLNQIEEIPHGTRTLLVIHPDYFETEQKIQVDSVFPTVKTKTKLKKYIPFKPTLRKIIKNTTEFLYPRLPLRLRWKISLIRYRRWVHHPLNPHYLNQIIEEGREFAAWVGPPGKCLDIGCGNGLFGGESYEDAGYSYLNPDDSSYIVGIDPLPLEGPQPFWLNEFHRGEAEKLPFPDKSFEKVVIATSLDHVADVTQVLKECKRVMNGSLYIWTTCFNKDYPIDFNHPDPFNDWELFLMISRAGLQVIRQKIIKMNTESCEIFIEAKESPL